MNNTEWIELDFEETCPHCDAVNEIVNHDVEKDRWVVKCKECGEEIMLCNVCDAYLEDTPRSCDWHEEIIDGVKCGVCFRGITHRLNEFKSSI